MSIDEDHPRPSRIIQEVVILISAFILSSWPLLCSPIYSSFQSQTGAPKKYSLSLLKFTLAVDTLIGPSNMFQGGKIVHRIIVNPYPHLESPGVPP